MTNVYGLRLLADVRIQRLGLIVLAGVAIANWLLQLPSFPADQVGYDFRFYWTAGWQLLHGQPIYSAEQLAGPYAPQGEPGRLLYPPPFAALMAPIVTVFRSTPSVAFLAWSGLGAVVLAASILALARAERLRERYQILAGNWAWLLVSAAIVWPPVVAELVYGNVNLFLVGLMTTAWLGLRRGSGQGDAMAGIALGFATLIKLFPGLLLLWLAMRGRWRPLRWAISSVVVLSVATLPLTGIEPWIQYPAVALNMSAPRIGALSLSPMSWLAPSVGFDAARVLVWGFALAMTAWAALRADDRVGFATVLVAALLATPALWKAYFSILVVPLLLALAAEVAPALVGLAYLLPSIGYQGALGDLAWITTRLVPSLSPIVLLAVLLWRAQASRDSRSYVASGGSS